MESQLKAESRSASSLFSKSTFKVPQYQREYSWGIDEVSEFWSDLKLALNDDDGSYFLGLIILTSEEKRYQVVDGQQRLITISLLAAALHHEADESKRQSLSGKIKSDFLEHVDYKTDDKAPKLMLSDPVDNNTFKRLISDGEAEKEFEEDSVSSNLVRSYDYLRKSVRDYISEDPFKRLGEWAEFISDQVYFAIFVHPDAASAYRVFEVVNTRGKELTTADLLKNHVLSQTNPNMRDAVYDRWQGIAQEFKQYSQGAFVQYIRHVVTVDGGHILPKDLFDFVSRRRSFHGRSAPSAPELISKLEENLSVYLQMIDPAASGPAEEEELKVYDALNELGIISLRPVLLAMRKHSDGLEGMKELLKLAVRRMVVANLGTGNVERKFGEAARLIEKNKNWREAFDKELKDLNPTKNEFVSQLSSKVLNKGILTFVRRSILQESITPNREGFIHYLCPRNASDWEGFSPEEIRYWGGSIGNTVLAYRARRPNNSSDWAGTKENLVPELLSQEPKQFLSNLSCWTSENAKDEGERMAERAGDVWFYE